jgi:charged multivesicular body protein 7
MPSNQLVLPPWLFLAAHMLKRKPSHDLVASGPHVSIFSDDPTLSRHKRKRSLFRSKHNRAQWAPEPERDMSELLEFVLQHEEAFSK